MQLSKYIWWLLIAVSLTVAYVFRTIEGVAPAVGAAGAMFLIPAMVLGVVILVGKLFKHPPSKTTRRAVFIPIWALALFSQVSQHSIRNRGMSRTLFVERCIQAAKDSAKYDVAAVMDLNAYCECSVNKMMERRGLDSAAMSQMKDRNSILFHEMILPCREAALYKRQGRVGNVFGLSTTDTVPVLSTELGVTVKVVIGDRAQYFLFDSGASDTFISSSFEEDLNKDGSIRGYLDDMTYEIANGDLVSCRRAIVDGFQVGGFSVDSVVVAVFEGDVQHLLGRSFLDNFSSWSFTSDKSELILVQ